MEVWKDVVGYEGYYQVSDQGRVRSLDRVSFGRNMSGRGLRPAPTSKYGHLSVSLSREGIRKTSLVHQLVAVAFIGPCPPGLEVLHGPSGVGDNSAGNLSYGTTKQNTLDRCRDGTSNFRPVRRGDGKEFANIQIAAKETGCCPSGVCAVCNGRQNSAGGFSWSYLEKL